MSLTMQLFNVIRFVISLSLFFIAASLMKHWVKVCRVKKSSLSLPVLNLKGKGFAEAERVYFESLRAYLQDGYNKYKHGFYQLFTPTGYLVIASGDFIKEMSQLPEGTLDFHGASQRRMVGDYKWLQIADDLLAYTIRTNLTRQLGNVLPAILEEIEYCIQAEFTQSKEWTPLSIQRLAPKMIAVIIGRVLVGPEINRDEEWVDSITQFVSDVYIGGVKLKGYSHFCRPFAARFLVPEIRRVWRHQNMARCRLVPILQSRSAVHASPRGQNLDLLQWLLDNNRQAAHPRSLEQLAELASVSYVGSTNTVSTTLTNILLDIAARPEDLAVLCEEVMRARADLDKQPTKEGLQLFSLKHTDKLDSFMKESQRMNPAHLMTFSRIVCKPCILSNGLTLTPGTHLMIPSSMISLDPSLYPLAHEFQGFRFSNARASSPKDFYKHQFTMTSPQAMHFGYGRNACPGRFLTSIVIKAFISTVLLKYDLKIEDKKPIYQALGARNLLSNNIKILLRKKVES